MTWALHRTWKKGEEHGELNVAMAQYTSATSFEGLLCVRLQGGALSPFFGVANRQTEKHHLQDECWQREAPVVRFGGRTRGK